MDGVPLLCFTFKDLQGRSGLISPVDNGLPTNIVANDTQKALFEMKSNLDICTNVVDLIAYTRNKVIISLIIFPVFLYNSNFSVQKEPVSNYLLALGGNPKVMSALTHVGNLVPHSTDRTAFFPNGNLIVNEETGYAEKFLAGSPRLYFPLREDMKIQITKIIRHVLQVNDNVAVPAKWVRYPQEEGDKKAKLLDQRIKWLVECLKTSRKDAQDLATKEYFHFFQPEDIDEEDPLGSLTEVSFYICKYNCNILYSFLMLYFSF